MPDYDYCITGAGCAGLSLLMRMLLEPALQHKKILVVDRDPKISNDRTWCFWEKGAGLFEEIVYHRWLELWFHDEQHSLLLPTAPYEYKMIRGIDFYDYCLNELRRFPNVRFLSGCVERVESDGESTYAVIDGGRVTASAIFNSISFGHPPRGPRDAMLLQHFKGWVIESLRPAFDPRKATLMDFRTTQDEGTTFFYVMPFSPTRALVECTLLSEELLVQEEYNNFLVDYIRRVLGIRDYRLLEREYGVIPMTTMTFPQVSNNIRHMGAAAGLTKPSTGYTFTFIQGDAAAIVESLVRRKRPVVRQREGRFRLYDRLFLNVLASGKLAGKDIFSSLFTKNAIPDLFAFLDNSSSAAQDWKIIRSLPTRPFLRAVADILHF